MLTQSAQIDQTIKSMNDHDLDFTVFVGDTKNGSTGCTNEAIGAQSMKIFDRLDFLRSIFFSKNFTQGRRPIEGERQGILGQAYSENSRFARKHVEFVALHISGSNNNLVATEKQCTNKSNRTHADYDAATAQYQARNAMDVAWLKESFDEARAHHYAGILIAVQADAWLHSWLIHRGAAP
jgi:hypothetical protein